MNARKHRRSGFTMTELLVASTLSVLVIGAVVFVFLSQGRAYSRQKQLADLHSNVRAAADVLADEVRMAGYGLCIPAGTFGQWVDWVSGLTGIVHVVQGATTNDADTLTVVGALDGEMTSLASAAAAGDTTITVASGDGARFNSTTSKMILVGKLESARVCSVSGDTLTLSTHPVQAGGGLRYGYAAGTPVEPVRAVTYTCVQNVVGYPHCPYLKRDDHTGVFTNDLQKLVSVGIENMQVTQTNETVRIVLTGMTREPDPAYTHPVEGDHYPRRVVSVLATPRNPF